jgi:hypothetical protein
MQVSFKLSPVQRSGWTISITSNEKKARRNKQRSQENRGKWKEKQ